MPSERERERRWTFVGRRGEHIAPTEKSFRISNAWIRLLVVYVEVISWKEEKKRVAWSESLFATSSRSRWTEEMTVVRYFTKRETFDRVSERRTREKITLPIIVSPWWKADVNKREFIRSADLERVSIFSLFSPLSSLRNFCSSVRNW